MDAEARLRRLESLEEIRCLKAHYCDLCDAGYDADAIVGLFTEDGVWDGGKLGRFEGREQLRRFFSGTASTLSFALHHITNPAIRLSDDGAQATARWYLLQTATLRRDKQAVILAGRYDDTLVQRNGEWKFAKIAINTWFFSPWDEGWAKTQWVMT